jgi:methionine biosynthesis protein MetW
MLPGLYDKVTQWIPEKARVLDLGTGNGEFLERLIREKKIRGEGVERNASYLELCIEKGLVVHHGDVLDGLDQYGDQAFDYVMLLGTFQELVLPPIVIDEAFRVSRNVIIAYNNFAYWRVRMELAVSGKMPVTRSMPYKWYESPNLNFCSVLDFTDMCRNLGYKVEKSAYFNSSREVSVHPNFFAEEALVHLSRS